MPATTTQIINGAWTQVASAANPTWIVQNVDQGVVEVGIFAEAPPDGTMGHPIENGEAATQAIGVGNVWVRSRNGLRGSHVVVTV